jgi:hypothetical protein
MENSQPGQSGQTMHQELKVVDAAAFSVGLIGPVGAIALLGTGAAAIIGRGVTLSFVFAAVGVALVAYCFINSRSTSRTRARSTPWSASRSAPAPASSPAGR